MTTVIPTTNIFSTPARVRAIEYHQDGTVKRVEYFDMPDAWVWGTSTPQAPTKTKDNSEAQSIASMIG